MQITVNWSRKIERGVVTRPSYMLLDLIFVWYYCKCDAKPQPQPQNNHFFQWIAKKKIIIRRNEWIMNRMRILLLMSYFQLYWSLAIQWHLNKERKSDAQWIFMSGRRDGWAVVMQQSLHYIIIIISTDIIIIVVINRLPVKMKWRRFA